MPSTPILFARLKDLSGADCIALLTERDFLWRADFPSEFHHVKLQDVVFVCTIERIRQYCSIYSKSAKLSGLNNTLSLKSIAAGGFIVASVCRIGKHRWGLRKYVFLCQNPTAAQQWVSSLRSTITFMNTHRPRRLLVLINPNAGHNQAEHIYSTIANPLFELAGIRTNIVLSTHRGFATEYLMKTPLEEFDGVICVGGDGFLSEAAQGLLLRERIEADLPLYAGHTPDSIELSTTLRLGVIPAGSTDTVAHSTQGCNDVFTSVLHIIVGDDIALDAASIHASSDGSFVRYALSMIGYGFHADLLKNDDARRWMGPRRYDYSGFSTFISHSIYTGTISYLPSANRLSHSSDGYMCMSGCSVCSLPALRTGSFEIGREVNETFLHTHGDNLKRSKSVGQLSLESLDSSESSNRYMRNNDCSKTVYFSLNGDRPPYSSKSTLNQSISTPNISEIFSAAHSNSNESMEFFKTVNNQRRKNKPEQSIRRYSKYDRRRISLQSSPSWTLQGCRDGWKTVSGCFVAINCFLQSCRCSKALLGPSPWSHLGDGCLDLILIPKCTRFQFLKYLIRIANYSKLSSSGGKFVGSNPLDLSFLTVVRVCALEFKSTSCVPLYSALSSSSLMVSLVSPHCKVLDGLQKYSRSEESNGLRVNEVNRSSTNRQSSKRSRNDSMWCSDGELIHHTNISVFVHRKLVRMFARGPEHFVDDTPTHLPRSQVIELNRLFETIVKSLESSTNAIALSAPQSSRVL